jgi:hypothetical protein
MLGCLVLPAMAWAIIPSDSTSSTLRDWWSTHQLHHRGEVCMATVTPSGSVDSPHATVLRRDAWSSGEMGGVEMRNCQYVSGTRQLFMYCGPDTTIRVKVVPRLVSTAFSLRSFYAYDEAVNGDTVRVWGYYCTSTGCYGSRPAGSGLDGAASSNDFQMDVIAWCSR